MLSRKKKNVISAFAKAIPKDLLQHCFILQLQFRTFEFDGFFLSRKRNGLSLLLFYCSASNDHLWQYFTFVSDKIASRRPDPSIYKIFSKRTFSLASQDQPSYAPNHKMRIKSKSKLECNRKISIKLTSITLLCERSEPFLNSNIQSLETVSQKNRQQQSTVELFLANLDF